MLCNALLSTIYDEMVVRDFIRREMLTLIFDESCFETMHRLILFMGQTYCRMWGKDFIRYLITTNFKDLTKVVRL